MMDDDTWIIPMLTMLPATAPAKVNKIVFAVGFILLFLSKLEKDIQLTCFILLVKLLALSLSMQKSKLLALLVGLIISSAASYACKCSKTTIESSYKQASFIFFGTYKGKSTEVGTNLLGKSIVFDNFLVEKVFKGPQTSRKDSNAYEVSIMNSCIFSDCGFCFEQGKSYLVYVQLDPILQSLTVTKCLRTRQIIQLNFIAPGQPDPDAGKNEWKELIRLAANDSTAIYSSTNQWFLNQAKNFEEEKIQLQKQLKKKTSMTIILSTSVLILAAYILLGLLKKKSS